MQSPNDDFETGTADSDAAPAGSATVSADPDAVPAGPGTVIQFHYDLYDSSAEKIESSRNAQPLLMLHGERNVLPALQAGFVGHRAGEDFTVAVGHEKAYGRYYPERKQRVPVKRIDPTGKVRLQAGQRVRFESADGPRQGSIVKLGRFNVDVDMNHPLAGRDLRFEISLLSVRQATEEELAHGHAHGPGGHQHA